MYTIKLEYESNQGFQDFLKGLRKQYSSFFHYSYNRLWEGKTKKEIYALISKLNNISLIKSRMINDCIDDANKQFEADKLTNKKSIFGGRKNFIKRCKNLITKEEWNDLRLRNLYLQGELARNGNRFFTLEIENQKLIFKYSKDKHFELKLNGSKKQFKELKKLQELKAKYTITLGEKNISITLDEIKKSEINLIENRFVGIDLNPENIGFSVCEMKKNKINILHKQSFDLKEIDGNKLNHEIFEISKTISKISKYWHCKYIFTEDLTIKSKEHNKGKTFNRLVNNKWKRNKFIDNLNKRCEENNQKLFKINPAYSSFIGNCTYDYFDSVNASIEIARRGYSCIILKNKQFYPVVELKNSLKHQWKETVNEMSGDWKTLFNSIKNLKLSYRVSLKDYSSFNVFRNKHSKIKCFVFI